MGLLMFAVVLLWIVVGLGCWVGYQLIRQNGRILLQVEELERRLAQLTAGEPAAPQGLPMGSVAPTFDLPDLHTGRMSLEQLRGQRLLLIFFNPGCGFCRQMAPDLAALPWGGRDGRPIPVVVTTGTVEQNRALVDEYAIHCPVLLQKQTEVITLYQVGGTPMGYLIDAEGRIASSLIVGAQDLLALAAPVAAPTDISIQGNNHKTHQGNRSLVDSRINRNGLPAGTPAPDFRLPRLDGEEITLTAYRGRHVLLVFSDPTCGPCDQLGPELERLHQRMPNVEVLMISRGELEINREKVSKHGLTFPIALQRHWEISRAYALFSVPIGYLIDEDGTIAADVAVGVEPILTLATNAATWAQGKEGMHIPLAATQLGA